MVHGKLRHSQPQRSAERENQDVDNMKLGQKQTKLRDSLKDCYHSVYKNRAHHEGIRCSPFL